MYKKSITICMYIVMVDGIYSVSVVPAIILRSFRNGTARVEHLHLSLIMHGNEIFYSKSLCIHTTFIHTYRSTVTHIFLTEQSCFYGNCSRLRISVSEGLNTKNATLCEELAQSAYRNPLKAVHYDYQIKWKNTNSV